MDDLLFQYETDPQPIIGSEIVYEEIQAIQSHIVIAQTDTYDNWLPR